MRVRSQRFRDRTEAGQVLAEQVAGLRLRQPHVLGLPRGGVPVAAEVAMALGAPLDVLVARKVGAPGHEEYGIGAVAEGGVSVRMQKTLHRLHISDAEFDRLAEAEQRRVEELVGRYRGGRPLADLAGRDLVIVDDGLATGVTAEAALQAARLLSPASLVLAEPVCASDTAWRLSAIADHICCAQTPDQLHAVGQWYEQFDPTPDAEVLRHLSGRVP